MKYFVNLLADFQKSKFNQTTLVTMLFALMFVFATSISVNAQIVMPICPIMKSTDCEQFAYGGNKTIEYPVGSGCFITFQYCYRNTCNNNLEIYIGNMFVDSGCSSLPDIDGKLYDACLQAAAVSHITFSIPPCIDDTVYVFIAGSQSCRTEWFPTEFDCYDGCMLMKGGYKSINCSMSLLDLCWHTVGYCWEETSPGKYVIKVIPGSNSIAGSTCPSGKLFVFLSDELFKSNDTCLSKVFEDFKKEDVDPYLDSVRDSIIQSIYPPMQLSDENIYNLVKSHFMDSYISSMAFEYLLNKLRGRIDPPPLDCDFCGSTMGGPCSSFTIANLIIELFKNTFIRGQIKCNTDCY